MATFTFELPDTMTVAVPKWAAELEVAVKDLSADMIRAAAELGLRQKIANGAAGAVQAACVTMAGAKRADETDKAYEARVAACAKDVSHDDVKAACLVGMQKVLDGLLAGSWGRERAAGEPGLDMELIRFAVATWGATIAKATPGWADMKVAERNRAVNAWLDAKDGRRDVVKEKLAESRAIIADI
jgi:hypothetical protein